MEAIPYLDSLIKEYLLFRGFKTTLEHFSGELSSDRCRGFQPEALCELLFGQLLPACRTGELMQLLELLADRLFSQLDASFDPVIARMEAALIKAALVGCVKAGKQDKVAEFFRHHHEKLLQGPDAVLWRPWAALAFVANPRKDPAFQAYFSPEWQQCLEVSFRNFLSEVMGALPLPKVLRYNEDRRTRLALQQQVDSLQREVEALRRQLHEQQQQLLLLHQEQQQRAATPLAPTPSDAKPHDQDQYQGAGAGTGTGTVAPGRDGVSASDDGWAGGKGRQAPAMQPSLPRATAPEEAAPAAAGEAPHAPVAAAAPAAGAAPTPAMPAGRGHHNRTLSLEAWTQQQQLLQQPQLLHHDATPPAPAPPASPFTRRSSGAGSSGVGSSSAGSFSWPVAAPAGEAAVAASGGGSSGRGSQSASLGSLQPPQQGKWLDSDAAAAATAAVSLATSLGRHSPYSEAALAEEGGAAGDADSEAGSRAPPEGPDPDGEDGDEAGAGGGRLADVDEAAEEGAFPGGMDLEEPAPGAARGVQASSPPHQPVHQPAPEPAQSEGHGLLEGAGEEEQVSSGGHLDEPATGAGVAGGGRWRIAAVHNGTGARAAQQAPAGGGGGPSGAQAAQAPQAGRGSGSGNGMGGSGDAVVACQFSPGGQNVATGGADGVVTVWCPPGVAQANPTRDARLYCGAPVTCLAWDTRADKVMLVGTSSRGVRAWHADTRRISADVAPDSAAPHVTQLACSRHEPIFVVATAASMPQLHGAAAVAAAGASGPHNARARASGAGQPPPSAASSCGSGGRLSLWNMRSFKRQHSYVVPGEEAVASLALHAQGSWFAAATYGGCVHLYDVATSASGAKPISSFMASGAAAGSGSSSGSSRGSWPGLRGALPHAPAVVQVWDNGSEALLVSCWCGELRTWSTRKLSEPLDTLRLPTPSYHPAAPAHHASNAAAGTAALPLQRGAIAAAAVSHDPLRHPLEPPPAAGHTQGQDPVATGAAGGGSTTAVSQWPWPASWLPCMALSPTGASAAVVLGGGPPDVYLVDLLPQSQQQQQQGAGAEPAGHSNGNGNGRVSVLQPRGVRQSLVHEAGSSSAGAGGWWSGPSPVACSWHPSQDVVVVGYSDGQVQTLLLGAQGHG